MNNILTGSGKLSVVFVCILLLTASAFAQAGFTKMLDFDGDGKVDFSVVRQTDSGGIFWYIKKSNGTFTYQPFGSAISDIVTPGDYDGDGKADISVFRPDNGVWYRLNSSNNTFVGVQFGLSIDEPVARDYDGDGKTDLAVARRTNGKIIWYVLGSTRGFYAAQFGNEGDFTAPGDYDGDGKFDFAVQRPGATDNSSAIFYILKSSDNNLLAYNWGFGSDLVVPGDYDGDGKTDVAVVREGSSPNSPLTWYIRGSRTGNLIAYSFGLTGSDLQADGDILVPGDYDGDGKTDIAVWRVSNSVFYVLKSTDGTLLTSQWGASTDVPVANYKVN